MPTLLNSSVPETIGNLTTYSCRLCARAKRLAREGQIDSRGLYRLLAHRCKRLVQIARRTDQSEHRELGDGDGVICRTGRSIGNSNAEFARRIYVDAFVTCAQGLHEREPRLIRHLLATDLTGSEYYVEALQWGSFTRRPEGQLVFSQPGLHTTKHLSCKNGLGV